MTATLLRRFLLDSARNGPNLLLLLVVPVAFVLMAAPALADAARLLGGAGGGPAIEIVTAGWAAAFLAAIAAYFEVSGGRTADRRLVIAGMPRARFMAARLLAAITLAALASAAALAALLARGVADDLWREGLGTLAFALTYVGIGALVGALVPDAVNGTVILLFVWILDVFFGPVLSGSDASVLRLLPTHFASLWMVDVPSGHAGPGELGWMVIWVFGALAAAGAVIVGRMAIRQPGRSRHVGVAQLSAVIRMGWKDWRRMPVMWILLAVVPAVFILLSDAITPSGHASVLVKEGGSSRWMMADPAEMHAGTMAPIAVASLAALVGVFLVLDTRAADRRIVIAGARRAVVLVSRAALALGATGVALVVALIVTAMVFTPRNWAVYAGGNTLLAATYLLLGMLLGPLFGRVSSIFLAFLIPFLDLGIWQSPMLSGEPAEWAQWLPGFGGTRLVIDGALTPRFDEIASLTTALGWLAMLALTAGAVSGVHGPRLRNPAPQPDAAVPPNGAPPPTSTSVGRERHSSSPGSNARARRGIDLEEGAGCVRPAGSTRAP